jgi:hypothetical protein
VRVVAPDDSPAGNELKNVLLRQGGREVRTARWRECSWPDAVGRAGSISECIAPFTQLPASLLGSQVASAC